MNADRAIEILEAHPDIRIVFTDINMPGSMDGLRLAKAIRDRWPPIELVITSSLNLAGLPDMPARGAFRGEALRPGRAGYVFLQRFAT